jgi:aminocarboxymuconate-semialdehyde decarboxylase
MSGVIDFHTHYIGPDIGHDALPGCVQLRREGERGDLYRDGAHYREIDDRSWDTARRIAEMDAEGVALQVLSPIPVSYGYESSADVGTRFAREQNEALAAVVRARPDRFAALGAVPLQDPDAACAALESAVREYGLAGVEIGTVANGRELDDPAFDAFWERAEALSAIVFIHPESFPDFTRVSKRMMVISSGYPSETGIAAAMLLTSGLLERRNLKIVLAHAGGTLPWLLPRMDRLWEIAEPARTTRARPSELARKLYCDTLTFDAANLALVLKRFDPEHVVTGSDYPFTVREVPPGAVIADGAPAHLHEQLRSANARRLLDGVNHT